MENEVRLINYDAAIDRYYAEYEKQDICDGAQDRDWLKKCFDEAPTIDPESLRPKGRWLKDRDGDEYCEICSRYMPVREVTGDPSAHNYCPNCGAKMTDNKGEINK